MAIKNITDSIFQLERVECDICKYRFGCYTTDSRFCPVHLVRATLIKTISGRDDYDISMYPAFEYHDDERSILRRIGIDLLGELYAKDKETHKTNGQKGTG